TLFRALGGDLVEHDRSADALEWNLAGDQMTDHLRGLFDDLGNDAQRGHQRLAHSIADLDLLHSELLGGVARGGTHPEIERLAALAQLVVLELPLGLTQRCDLFLRARAPSEGEGLIAKLIERQNQGEE